MSTCIFPKCVEGLIRGFRYTKRIIDRGGGRVSPILCSYGDIIFTCKNHEATVVYDLKRIDGGNSWKELTIEEFECARILNE